MTTFCNQDDESIQTPLSISDVPTLQVGQAVTRIDSNGTRVPAIISKVIIWFISGDPVYPIESTSNQYHQAKIDYLRKPSDPEKFFINSTIRPLNTNTTPKTPAETIGFGTHLHTPSTTTAYPAYPVDQHLQQRCQPAVTGYKIIAENTTHDTPILIENGCDLSKLLLLLRNLTLKDYTLIALKIVMIKLL